jgi:peptidoglycan/xylan/chitin deacetylase (PgdA/CDA1 family)
MLVRNLVFVAVLNLSVACAAPSTPVPAARPEPVPALGSAPPAATPPAAGARPRIVISQCHVDGPFIAMTFDDGPHITNTPRLLDMLKQRGLKATFFVVGQCVAEYPDIMKRIVSEGHEVASHSWSHPLLSKMGEGAVTDQLQRTHDVIVQTTGVAPKVMRPPYGGFTANQSAWANRKWDYKVILWDVDPLDWKVRNSDAVKSKILAGTVNGSIILSHDIHKSTIDAMPETLDGLTAKGFKFVTVSELLAMDRPPAAKPRATPAPKATPAAKTTLSEGPTTPPVEQAAPPDLAVPKKR